jgi:hypothetical protein
MLWPPNVVFLLAAGIDDEGSPVLLKDEAEE